MSIAPVPIGSGDLPEPASLVEVKPPALPWALLLLIELITAGCFGLYWSFVQAGFARRIDEKSTASLWYTWWLGTVACLVLFSVVSGSAAAGRSVAYGVLYLACLLCYQAGNFNIKKSLEIYYEAMGQANRRVSGRMLIFFGPVYLQYHLCKIREQRSSAQ